MKIQARANLMIRDNFTLLAAAILVPMQFLLMHGWCSRAGIVPRELIRGRERAVPTNSECEMSN